MKLTEAIRQRPGLLLEGVLASLLLVWRCVAPTWHPVYLDILFYLGLYWILLLFTSKAELIENVTVLLMLALMAIYLKGQMAHMLVVVDLLP